MPPDSRTVRYNDFEVVWYPALDGGGRAFGQDFVPLVAGLFGKVGRLFECCAGPGFIGFSLQAHGLCEELVLGDINPAAVEVMRETVRRNGLTDRTTVYQSDGLAGIPATERFDLVVANPPHFHGQPIPERNILTEDPDWRFHRAFYRDIGRYLTGTGSVLMQENSEGSTPEDFLPMIAAGGLDHVRTLWFRGGRAGPSFYYLWARKRLPGTVTYDGALPVTVALSTVGSAPVLLPIDTVLKISLHNQTDRPVRVKLLDAAGGEQLWVPVPELAPGATGELPLLVPAPGDHRLVDQLTQATLARIRVEGTVSA